MFNNTNVNILKDTILNLTQKGSHVKAYTNLIETLTKLGRPIYITHEKREYILEGYHFSLYYQHKYNIVSIEVNKNNLQRTKGPLSFKCNINYFK